MGTYNMKFNTAFKFIILFAMTSPAFANLQERYNEAMQGFFAKENTRAFFEHKINVLAEHALSQHIEARRELPDCLLLLTQFGISADEIAKFMSSNTAEKRENRLITLKTALLISRFNCNRHSMQGAQESTGLECLYDCFCGCIWPRKIATYKDLGRLLENLCNELKKEMNPEAPAFSALIVDVG